MLTSHALLRRSAAGVAALTVLASSGVAVATASVTNGSAHCVVTARQPRLDVATNQLSGSAIVQCDITTMVSVDLRVVELDGAGLTVIDPTTVIPRVVKVVAVNAGTSKMVITGNVTCVNTEPGNEEYSTRARVTLFGTQSAADFTVPLVDSYAC